VTTIKRDHDPLAVPPGFLLRTQDGAEYQLTDVNGCRVVCMGTRERCITYAWSFFQLSEPAWADEIRRLRALESEQP
jgi:hypothetical protein